MVKLDLCTIENLENFIKLRLPFTQVILVLIFGYVILQFLKLTKIEREIVRTEAEATEIPKAVLKRVQGFDVNNAQYEKLVAKELKPFERKLKSIYKDRQFVLDKLSLLSLLRR